MSHRTFAVGDIHGDFGALLTVLGKLPPLDSEDTLVFLGDYLDRGPDSARLIRFLRLDIHRYVSCKVVVLRGNHEDGWLRVRDGGWPEFVLPPQNGCLATYLSYVSSAAMQRGETAAARLPDTRDLQDMQDAMFFPEEDLQFFASMPHYYEDEHAIYVHAGLPESAPGTFLHPSEVEEKALLLWVRTLRFFTTYDGKQVVVGHTSTDCLPPDLSEYTPEDPLDMWQRGKVLAIDTGAGKGGFLTVVELPGAPDLRGVMRPVVYESRSSPSGSARHPALATSAHDE